MPFRFHCTNCRQPLSVARQQQGQPVKCPRCHRVIRVPVGDPETGRSADSRPPDGPLQEFPETDGHAELVYVDTEPGSAATDRAVSSRISVPRWVLYTQGFLLGAVALVFFVLGMIVGNRASVRNVANATPHPVRIEGVVQYQGRDGRTVPDAGSVILLLPVARRPEEKAPVAGLRPDEPQPPDDHPALLMLRRIGGVYTRADRHGQYRVRAVAARSYYLLVISRARDRGSDQRVAASHLAQLGRYVLPATELLGQKRYRWTELQTHQDQHLDVTF